MGLDFFTFRPNRWQTHHYRLVFCGLKFVMFMLPRNLSSPVVAGEMHAPGKVHHENAPLRSPAARKTLTSTITPAEIQCFPSSSITCNIMRQNLGNMFCPIDYLYKICCSIQACSVLHPVWVAVVSPIPISDSQHRLIFPSTASETSAWRVATWSTYLCSYLSSLIELIINSFHTAVLVRLMNGATILRLVLCAAFKNGAQISPVLVYSNCENGSSLTGAFFIIFVSLVAFSFVTRKCKALHGCISRTSVRLFA